MRAMMKGITAEGILGFIYVNSIVFLQAVSLNCYLSFGCILWPISKSLYYQLQQLGMSIWGRTLPYLVETFCPAEFVVYVDPSCGAKAESLEQDKLTGAVVGLRMPARTVVMSNHQIYPDWIYLWCLAYFARAHGHVKIMLKDSLAKLPFFGSIG
ncbi:hypothetical protein BX666DRAFT_270651 [Dichotomocladium elegans]|nr:hypothetical protein BX666DRAFT_270651 [Dichotomocladium elegans]